MHIQFWGAAHDVTGSKHLLFINGKRILLDCGLFQGKRVESFEKNKNLPFSAKDLDAVILSHAHLDHCGGLPILFKNGYTGKIHCTKKTADIVPIMLEDSAHIQEMDNKYVAKHIENPKLSVEEPLYTMEDVKPTVAAIVGHNFHERFEIFHDIFVEFYYAGHILGAASVKITFVENGKEKILVFSGDMGRRQKNMLHDPESEERADYLIVESTYGNRFHEDNDSIRNHLAKIINEAVEKRGKIIIPSFALQRTQELVYDLHLLQMENKIPRIPVFVDSPMAKRVTEVYVKYQKQFDEESHEDFFKKGSRPLESQFITYVEDVEASKALKNFSGPAIILSASGMCDAGRIRHHIKNEIENPNSTILFVGYQAEYTLGRRILEGRPTVKIFDQMYSVKAKIEKINGYSGHADQGELLEFIRPIKDLSVVFVVHGEPEQSYAFAKLLRQEAGRNWVVDVPEMGDDINPEMCLNNGTCDV